MPGERSFFARLGRLSAIITILPASMAAGWLMGHFLLDRPLGWFPWGGVCFTVVGAVAGFFEIVRLLTGDRKR